MRKRLSLIVLFVVASLLMVACSKKETFTVIYESNGGTLIASEQVVKGDKVPEPIEPVKIGFKFNKWYKNVELTEEFIFANYVIESNLTIYAKWIEDTDGEEPDVPVDPTKELIVTVDGVEYKLFKGEKLPKIDHKEVVGKVFLGFAHNGVIFDMNSQVLESMALVSTYRDADRYQITIANTSINGNNKFSFYENEEVVLGVPTHELDFEFEGWYLDQDYKNEYILDYLKDDVTIYAKFIEDGKEVISEFKTGAYLESLWAVWNDELVLDKVEYKKSTSSNWILVDQELIRKNKSETRIDIVGLEKGYYDIKITTTTDETKLSERIYVAEHDRSGYAHFNYNEGIGAYKDNGKLKDDAIVVYVTEENKDQITIPGIGQVGLGWIMNNAQYSSNDKPSYDLDKYKVSLAYFNKPIVFRIIGKVTTPEGATAYNSLENGGSKGDNGHMVRMRDAKNITIEGIGEDAVIHGWGIHFMAASTGRGIGFEVRNITFDKYAEDAVGMEGVQSGTTLTYPVQRGWIHNTTFLPGYAENPAESDKGFGDGSLDIKRGEYFTISYNQFIETHKTNLVGASDSNLQYHITYHHNLWYNVQSRIPLSRQANIHMYNNVYETSDDNKGENSTAQDVRANAYIFSEANYFYATKNSTKVRSGAVKSFGDVKYSTYDTDDSTVVKSRTEQVSNSNKYSDFDTNAKVFYYDEVNKRSDVILLTDAVTARTDVYKLSGVFKSDNSFDEEKLKITNETPEVITESVSGQGRKINKGTTFKVFTINDRAEFEMVSTNKVPAVLVDIYGRVIITGTGSALLEPGTYVIESSISHGSSKGTSQAKDSHIDSYSIKIDETSSEDKIEHVNDLIDLIPDTIIYSEEHKKLIDNATDAYNRLSNEEKSLVDFTKVTNALREFNNLGATYIEGLISNIGEVTVDSFDDIANARNAYNKSSNEIKALVKNINVLIEAESLFQEFIVDSLNNKIIGLDNLENLIGKDLNDILEILIDYNNVYEEYLGLDEDKQPLINNINKVINGIKVLENIKLAFELNELIDSLDENHLDIPEMNLIKEIYELYNDLLDTSKSFVTSSNKAKLDVLYELYLEYKEQVREELYYFEVNNPYFSVSGKSGNIPETEVDGITINKGLKLESSTLFSFTTAKESTVYIQMTEGSGLHINGVLYQPTDSSNFIEVKLDAGTQVITRNGTKGVIVYLKVIEG